MSDLNVPPERAPEKPIPLLVPVSHEFADQAKSILKGAGLSIVARKFLLVNEQRMADESSEDLYGYDKQSTFGTPVFDTIKLNEVKYQNFEGKQITVPTFVLDIALVEVYNDRNIIRTKLAGRNGAVKEYMSDDDYYIKITGQLINPLANIPPEDLIRRLNGFCKAETEIKVNSTVLSYLDIFTIVILRPHFRQRMGERNVFDYELECVSETPFELKQDA